MSRPIIVACAFLLGSAANTACSSDDTIGSSDAGTGGSAESGPGTGGKGGSGGMAGASGNGGGGMPTDGGDAGTKVKVTGTAVVAIPGKYGNEEPLPGTSVCVTGKAGDKIISISCVTTGATGTFEFSLASGTQVVIELQKVGYGPQLIAVDVGTAEIARGDVRLAP